MSVRAAANDPAERKRSEEFKTRVSRCSPRIQEIYHALRAPVERLPEVTTTVDSKVDGVYFKRNERRFFTLHPKHSAKIDNIGVGFFGLDEDEVEETTGIEPRDLKQDGIWIRVNKDSSKDAVVAVVACAMRAYDLAAPRNATATRRRVQPELPELEQERQRAEEEGAFDASNWSDARAKVLAAIVQRQGQPKFRKGLLEAYQGRCTITGCTLQCVLEAAHIVPYRGKHTNHLSNGLLLRADIHTLFDLGLISIDSKTMTVLVASSLGSTPYGQYAGQRITLPDVPKHRPSIDGLDLHRKSAQVALT